MADLKDGETAEMQGSGAKPYILKNVGGVYSCDCMAWRNQSIHPDKRTCKHLRKYCGDAAEEARLKTNLEPVRKPKEGAAVAPPLLLAHTWDGVLDPTGWWMSEKLDGVRAYWNGKEFISRNGNVYLAPDWFKKGLSDLPLDGELWMGRKMFQATSGIVRRQDAGDLWKKLTFVVFDAPLIQGTFERRNESIPLLIGSCSYAKHHGQIVVGNKSNIQEALESVEKMDGEGLMLRKPGSMYEVGRSMTLLKVKSFFDDEATVTGYQKGKGKHKGKVGALLVKLENGTEFEIGTGLSDAERASPPEIGAVVKFKYQELTDGGVPRFPVFLSKLD